MTAAVTPKGERRRGALVDAAADLLLEGGLDAVRHRAVAARAELPLASTTYYFESLDDLVAAAVETCGNRELDLMRSRLVEVTQRNRGVTATVEVLVDMLIGVFESEDGTRELLVSRCERFVTFARHPELRETQLRLRAQLEDLIIEALRRSGREIDQINLRQLVCVVDGAAVGALSAADANPMAFARDMLVQVIDVLAPMAAR
ncbi:TetR/AcrR family transcriptional regulator [Rhodococcus kronopolitis]|uniref:TetR/AcrR family transcriptional regulator n=1 Tax=Rhodococcus kronopolitis TaxID=1460226 RepID=A0ABV9FRF2_9NOCA